MPKFWERLEDVAANSSWRTRVIVSKEGLLSWVLDGEFPGYRTGFKIFPVRETVHTQEHPIMKGPTGMNVQAVKLQDATLPELRGLNFFVGSGEPMRVSRLWIYKTQSLVRKMGSGKSGSSGLNLTETHVREFWQFLT